MALHPKVHLSIEVTAVRKYAPYEDGIDRPLDKWDIDGTQYFKDLIEEQFGDYEGKVEVKHTLVALPDGSLDAEAVA